MKLLHILGARPQFIKYYPIQQAIKKLQQERPVRNRLQENNAYGDGCSAERIIDTLCRDCKHA